MPNPSKKQCIRSAEPGYRLYQQRGLRSQTPTQHQMLWNDHGNGLTNWYSGPTLHGTVNNGIYIPVRLRYDNTDRSSAQPNIQSHIDVTTSMVKAFQQQVLIEQYIDVHASNFVKKRINLTPGSQQWKMQQNYHTKIP